MIFNGVSKQANVSRIRSFQLFCCILTTVFADGAARKSSKVIPVLSQVEVVKPYMYPWMVSVQHYENDGNWQHVCSGVLLNQRWVMTMNSCIHSDFERMRLAFSKHNLALVESFEEYQPIERTFVFSADDGSAMICLIRRLAMYTVRPKVVYPICHTQLRPEAFQDASCVLVGWGYSKYQYRVSYLHHGKVKIMDQERCRNELVELGSAYDELTDAHCAEVLRPNLVEGGEQGSPIFCIEDGKFVLVGLVNYYHMLNKHLVGFVGNSKTLAIFSGETIDPPYVNENVTTSGSFVSITPTINMNAS